MITAVFAGALAGGLTGVFGGLGVVAVWKGLSEKPDEEIAAEPEETPAVSAVGKLRVLSQPAGATVSVDGRAAGATPLELTSPPGIHALAFALDGHEPHRLDVSLDPGESMTVSVSLLPTPEEEPEARPAGRGGGGYRGPVASRRNCSGEQHECERACDDAAWSCRGGCMYCSGCVTSMSQEECTRICNTCRQGCEQNELFCDRQCEAQARSCF